MADPRPTKKYPCSQAELYAICTIGWQSYQENLADFVAFSTKYDAQYATDALQAVEAAKQLPDFQARNEPAETSYREMVKTVDLCNRNWRKLRRHIANAFNNDIVKGKIEAAGEPHYKKSMNRNWAETELMLTSATTFMTDNATELTAGGMPAQFVTDFGNAKTTFLGHYAAFTDAGQDEVEGTDQKLNANNAIYATLTAMFDDGQVIYEDNPAKRERFIFTRVWELISSSGGSGSTPLPSDVIEIGFLVFDSMTELPIGAATIQVLGNATTEPVIAVTGQDGTATLKLTGLQPNQTVLLEIQITAPEFDAVNGQFEFMTGQRYSFEVPMIPLTALPPQP